MIWRRWSLAAIIAGMVVDTSTLVSAGDSLPDDQSNLQPLVNSGGTELKFNWPMLRIGTAE